MIIKIGKDYFHTFRNKYDMNDRDFIGGIERNLKSIQKYFPDHIMRLYYQVPANSSFLKDICHLACSSSNLDLCNIEKIPSIGKILV